MSTIVNMQDELNDCLSNSIAISDLLINVNDVPDETIPQIGSMLNSKLRRAQELNGELWKALQSANGGES